MTVHLRIVNTSDAYLSLKEEEDGHEAGSKDYPAGESAREDVVMSTVTVAHLDVTNAMLTCLWKKKEMDTKQTAKTIRQESHHERT